MNTTPEAVISISVDKGAETSPSVFQFDVKHIFPATDVLIQSARGPPTTGFDITIDGDKKATVPLTVSQLPAQQQH